MDELIYLYSVAVVLAAALAMITIWAPRSVRVKVLALAVTALFVPAGYGSLATLLSRPKPVDFEWAKREIPEATVLSASVEEGQAIYLWLQIPGVREPRSYALPWQEGMAKQLMQATREAEERGRHVKMWRPFERNVDEAEHKFYAEPQPHMPAKTAPRQRPFTY